MPALDPHERPPEHIRDVYKKYQKMKSRDLEKDPALVDLERVIHTDLDAKLRVVDEWDPQRLTATFRRFGGDHDHEDPGATFHTSKLPVYEHQDMPGLLIIPSLLPPEIQRSLLSRLLHRDLAQPSHLTNIHTHYDISYPPRASSFFSLPPISSATVAEPIDPAVHKPLDVSQLLNKKMRWMTLGGQYDWTAKRYPDAAPPSFPSDVKDVLEDVFAETKAEAAIVNLYSPGDTLSVHRDVAESSNTGLISVSMGCDAIFIIGTSAESAPTPDGATNDGRSPPKKGKVLAIRLRSGSAVYMSGTSRFAWHGVPQIVPGTCPPHLESWPAGEHVGDNEYEAWRGWMTSKRINVNVRQMFD
ncbi:oxidoreductase [Bimuria novae-zelandiae CBS 107.79]|uniref:mRNA N(6)-methyladenine demethylase n=1 Tax=Bimuria novae-zelandiae CBS 107.79 TaxID=1447943 RepID=A0A6A5UXD0_9PLEO|nr:oxidoreductase [Bimuria novae-zelandiae CBS 107.79]